MRAAALALGFLLAAALLAPSANAEDFGAIGKVNGLIGIKESPQLAPGDSGRFVFYFNSTYTVPIQSVRLNASIYRYATIDGSVPIDGSWPYAFPKIQESGNRTWVWTNAAIAPGRLPALLNFTILTAADSNQMPHGSIFSQSSYFVRFWLEFTANVSGTPTQFRMASRGFFTTAQWDTATNKTNTTPCTPPGCRGNVNLTRLGVDGILPDSSFGVKEPIPRWPFYLLIAFAVFFLILAFLFWVEENPGTYPRIGTWWARTRGRITRTIAPLRSRRRPKS